MQPAFLLALTVAIALVAIGAPVGASAYDGWPLVVRDSFNRTASNGWGYTEPANGMRFEWDRFGPASAFSVADGAGLMRITGPAIGRGMKVDDGWENVDVTVRVNVNKVASAGTMYVYVGARGVYYAGPNPFTTALDEIRGRLAFNGDGTISIGATQVIDYVERPLGDPYVLPGLRQSPSKWFWLRVEVVDQRRGEPEVRVKAWQAGQPEPEWQWSAETWMSYGQHYAGWVALRSYVSSGASNAPVTFRFDSFRIRNADF